MGHPCLFEGKTPVTLEGTEKPTNVSKNQYLSDSPPGMHFPVVLQRFQVTPELQLEFPLVKYNANEPATEEVIKGFKAKSLHEPSETSTAFSTAC